MARSCMANPGTRSVLAIALVSGVTAVLAPPAAAQSLLLKPPAEAPPPSGYALRPTADGGYTYQTEAFRVVIAPDGGVVFHDRGVFIRKIKLGPLDLTPGQRSNDRPARPTL